MVALEQEQVGAEDPKSRLEVLVTVEVPRPARRGARLILKNLAHSQIIRRSSTLAREL